MSRISRRLLASVAALIILVVLSLALVSGYVLRRELLGSLEDDLARQARQFAVVLRSDAESGARTATDLDALQDLVREAGTASEVRLTVVAGDGTVLADAAEDPAVMDNHATRPEVVVALAGGEGRSRRFSATLGADAVYVAVPVDSPGGPWAQGVVRASVGTARIEPLLDGVWRLPLGIGAVALVPALIVAFALSRSLTRPIERLRGMAVNVAAGDLGYRVATPRRTDELGELARALNQMAHDLERRVHQLHDERARMAEVLASMDDGVMVIDADGVVAGVNPAAARMVGSTVEDLEGQPIVRVARAFPAQSLVDEALNGGIPYTNSVELTGDRTLEVRVAPLTQQGAGTPKVLIVLHDVTERTRVDRIRKDFVANVSHELKTPLAGISLLSETLRRAVHEDPESAEGFAERVSLEIRRLTDLVEDLLALSVLDEGRMFEAAPGRLVDLMEIVRREVEEYRPRASGRDIALTLNGPPEAPLIGDEVGLATLVRNLVDNALRYTEPSGHVRVSVEADRREVVLRVRDDGIGIPRDDRDRIFERFYRVDKARSRDTGGTGLGLSIVRNVAALHGGAVSVESAVGVGSTFTVRFPAPSEPVDPAAGERSAAPEPEGSSPPDSSVGPA